MSYHQVPSQPVFQWLPEPRRVECLPDEQPSVQILDPYVALGDLHIEHDWPTQTTKLNATGWAEKVMTLGLLGFGAYLAYKKLS